MKCHDRPRTTADDKCVRAQLLRYRDRLSRLYWCRQANEGTRQMKLAKALMIGAIFTAGVAFAEAERTDPNAIARSNLMKTIGKNTGILGNMAGGKDPYDAAGAAAAKAAIVEAAGMIEATFKEQGAADPADEAKPEIWTEWDDFLADAKKLGDAASAMDVASAETIGAGMGALGGACKDCHTEFRIMKQ
jgi:cytochrome c556